MPVSQSLIDALTEAIASGESVVRHGDKTIEYRSVGELVKARNTLLELQQQEAGVSHGAGGPLSRVTRLAHGGRGFDR